MHLHDCECGDNYAPCWRNNCVESTRFVGRCCEEHYQREREIEHQAAIEHAIAKSST